MTVVRELSAFGKFARVTTDGEMAREGDTFKALEAMAKISFVEMTVPGVPCIEIMICSAWASNISGNACMRAANLELYKTI